MIYQLENASRGEESYYFGADRYHESMERLRERSEAAKPVIQEPIEPTVPKVEETIAPTERAKVEPRTETPKVAFPEAISSRIDNEVEVFSKYIDDYHTGANTGKNPLLIGDTHEILQFLGAPQHPMRINYSVLDKAFKKHGIDGEVIKQMPRAINDPILVASYPNNPSIVNMITDIVDKDGSHILVGIDFEKLHGHYSVNNITTIHPKRALSDWLDKVKQADGIRYLNIEKATNSDMLPAPIASQSEKSGLTLQDLLSVDNPNIKREADFVKYLNEQPRPDVNAKETAPLTPEVKPAPKQTAEVTNAVRKLDNDIRRSIEYEAKAEAKGDTLQAEFARKETKKLITQRDELLNSPPPFS